MAKKKATKKKAAKKTIKKKATKKKAANTSASMEQTHYEEVGRTYRFFLIWRSAAAAGVVAILWGTLSLAISINRCLPSLAWLVPLFGIMICLILWESEERIRELCTGIRELGKSLEQDNRAVYTKLVDVGTKADDPTWKKLFSHGGAFTILTVITCAMLLVTSFTFLLSAFVC